jgi:drug/metabolite transporter (DMT)-like permease
VKSTLDHKHATIAGVALMSIAALTIPIVDGIAKYLSSAHSPLYIAWARYAAACAVVLPLALARDGKAFLPREQVGAHLLRTVFLVAAMTCYFLAIAHVPLATAISAYFVGPIIAMVLAIILLGEALTARKIVSLVLGFVGALVILRPTGSIDPNLLLALGSGAFFALYMIATRQASRASDPIKTLAFQCLLGAALLTPQAIWTWSIPSRGEVWLFVAMGGCPRAATSSRSRRSATPRPRRSRRSSILSSWARLRSVMSRSVMFRTPIPGSAPSQSFSPA